MDAFEISSMLNTGLLWFLAATGAWNALNWQVRAHFKKPDPRFNFSIFAGAWAALVLLLETL